MTEPYRPTERTGGAGIGPAGAIPAGSFYTDEPTVDLGAALLDFYFDRTPLDIAQTDASSDFLFDRMARDFFFDDK